ncbi:MAG: hypothetical protein H0S85_05525 [Desulfovibrionaceae bacterium]|nr:hypothetical protein [Desulfovibrionaceae bacterium]
MDGYTRTIEIAGEEYRYDPVAEMAILYCSSCGQPNEVPVFREGDAWVASGFVCEHCGAWNATAE